MLGATNQPPGKFLNSMLIAFIMKRLSLGQSSAKEGRISLWQFDYGRNVSLRVFIIFIIGPEQSLQKFPSLTSAQGKEMSRLAV